MKTTVDKEWLIVTLEKNRARHRETFLKVQEKFRTAAIEEFEKRLKLAREGKPIDLYVRLVEPKDQTKDYNRIISMLENSTEKNITLDEDDYSCYVMDSWNWKDQWTTVSNSYGVDVKDDD